MVNVDNIELSKKERYAAACAAGWHFWQKRKYTGEPYFNHLVNVATLVKKAGGDEDMVCAAFLHDIVEDTEVTINNLRHWFGDGVADLVDQVTDVSKPEDGNREKRKEMDRRHIAAATPRAKTIKLADLIDNSSSIIERDPEFAKVYIEEKRELLKVLHGGDSLLWWRANEIVSAHTSSDAKS